MPGPSFSIEDYFKGTVSSMDEGWTVYKIIITISSTLTSPLKSYTNFNVVSVSSGYGGKDFNGKPVPER